MEAKIVPMQISYEIICEAARTPPRNAYLELLLHPAKITVCTLKAPIIITINVAYCNSNVTKTFETGIINQSNSINNNEHSGAAINITAFELVGANNSFLNSLRPSAIGCRLPNIPTLLGPRLLCILPMVLRSNRVITAIDSSNGTAYEINNSDKSNISFAIVSTLSYSMYIR